VIVREWEGRGVGRENESRGSAMLGGQRERDLRGASNSGHVSRQHVSCPAQLHLLHLIVDTVATGEGGVTAQPICL